MMPRHVSLITFSYSCSPRLYCEKKMADPMNTKPTMSRKINTFCRTASVNVFTPITLTRLSENPTRSWSRARDPAGAGLVDVMATASVMMSHPPFIFLQRIQKQRFQRRLRMLDRHNRRPGSLHRLFDSLQGGDMNIMNCNS